jgi:serine/threonine protein kinase
MNANPHQPIDCPNCGLPLPLGILQGLCPACLLVQGGDTEPAGPQARSRFEPPPLERIASLFPQLEVLGLLGAGGMGAVYQARQPALDRLVALKVLPAGGGGGSAERFNREARALARLSHPNIVTVHEFGQAEDFRFFIMEYVDGTNLRQLEKSSRLSPREALQIIPQICDALQYAHDEGVVHRDIKPENVLVDRKGRVKIADFGLAKILDANPDAARLTADGQVMGTPHYMAPEQVERPLAVDHRADIYALGVVFYEMLTGDLPIGKFPPPSRKVQVDVRIDDIVLRALENDPERRYQQASEVKSEVQTVADAPAPHPSTADSSPHTVPDLNRTGVEPFVPWWQSRRFQGFILFYLLLLIAIGLLFQDKWLTPRLARVFDSPDTRRVQVATRDPQTGSWFADLPNGGRIDLLAISRFNAAPNQWWQPDGSPAANTTFQIEGPAEILGKLGTKAQLAFQVTGSPAIIETAIYDFVPPANISAGGHVLAVDLDGEEHLGNHGKSTPVDSTETWTWTFHNMTVDRVSEFQVQVQPIHWIEFRDAALQPHGPFHPEL